VGFLVLNEAYLVVRRSRRGRHYRLSSHSRLALIVLGLMSLLGTAVVYWSEGVYSSQGWLQASFQAITAASTTGFNTVDIGQMSDTSQAVLSVLMFIGSPSGGTGGGIKSTTFGVIMLLLWALLRNHSYVNFSGRRLSTQTLIKSVGIGITAVIWLLLVTICLTATEEKSFLSLLFEATSALGTVGLSTGLTSQLSVFGKLLLTATMFIGRVGPLTVALSLFGVQTERKVYRYPQEEIFVG
jgi:trk system potassium uptake protein TrkH